MLTLSSDFGSPYPAAMRGVLCQLTDARLVDVAHDFPRQDVRSAAFWLREVLPYFPSATHLVVVDPGVGTDRAVLVVRAGEHALVGPDNGVLWPAARALADGDPIESFAVDVAGDPPLLTIPNAPTGRSTTFHGRDVFAPVAARVHETDRQRLDAVEGLSRTDPAVELRLPIATVDGDRSTGAVLAVDDFGNVITNVPGAVLEQVDSVTVNGRSVPVGRTFADVAADAAVALVGSHGHVELAVNRGRGDDRFGLTTGDEVVVETA